MKADVLKRDKLKDIFISYKNDGEGNHFAARLFEDLKRERYSVYFNPDEEKSGNFPEQYLKTPFSVFKDILISVNDGADDYRDVYCSNTLIDSVKYRNDVMAEADNGDIESMYKAGMLCFHGVAGERDFKKAAFLLKKVSDTNHPLATYANTLIARMYYSGSMPREGQSYEKSYEYHKKAEKDPYSAAQIAFMQRMGSGCNYDYDIIEKYYLGIIDFQDEMCKMELAEFYELHGFFMKAANIYNDLVEVVPEAAYKLGIMYKNGVLMTPPKPDYRSAANYFKIAAEQGNVNAMYEYGVIHFNPTGNLKKNFQEAQKYFEKAADKGHMTAQYILGYMYEYGHVEKDYVKAISYYERAVEQGHVFAGMHLAVLYQQAEHHNYQKAFQYCLFSVEHGCALANFLLGNMYLFGCGCKANEDKAFLYYKKAIDMGIYDAQIMMEEAEKIFSES